MEGSVRLRVPQAAQYLGLSASTLNKMRCTGGGPSFIKMGGTVVYDRADLDDFLARHRRRSTSEAAA